MAARRRTATKLASDRREAARLALMGQTQDEIAEQLEVSRQQITYDLGKLRQEWRRDAQEHIGELFACTNAKIDVLERTYWAAWEESKKPKQVLTAETVTGGATGREKTIAREEGQCGDPRYLQGVQWCVEKRCELFGLYAPKKQEFSGPNGEPIAVDQRKAFADLSDDELDRLLAKAEQSAAVS